MVYHHVSHNVSLTINHQKLKVRRNLPLPPQTISLGMAEPHEAGLLRRAAKALGSALWQMVLLPFEIISWILPPWAITLIKIVVVATAVGVGVYVTKKSVHETITITTTIKEQIRGLNWTTLVKHAETNAKALQLRLVSAHRELNSAFELMDTIRKQGLMKTLAQQADQEMRESKLGNMLQTLQEDTLLYGPRKRSLPELTNNTNHSSPTQRLEHEWNSWMVFMDILLGNSPVETVLFQGYTTNLCEMLPPSTTHYVYTSQAYRACKCVTKTLVLTRWCEITNNQAVSKAQALLVLSPPANRSSPLAIPYIKPLPPHPR
jgi:hypothetical protein